LLRGCKVNEFLDGMRATGVLANSDELLGAERCEKSESLLSRTML